MTPTTPSEGADPDPPSQPKDFMHRCPDPGAGGRDTFEAWARDTLGVVRFTRTTTAHEDCYHQPDMQCAWIAWQSSRRQAMEECYRVVEDTVRAVDAADALSAIRALAKGAP